MEHTIPGKLMQMAKRRLMIKPAPSTSHWYDSAMNDRDCIRILEQSIQVLDKLIKICNSSSRNTGSSITNTTVLKFNHAQCRFLDLQSFHDNLRNLMDEMMSIDASSRLQCRTSVLEIARVARNAEVLVLSCSCSFEEHDEESWLKKAVVHGLENGLSSLQQKQEQQWCVSVLEVVLAQFRAERDVSKRAVHSVPFWMIDRLFEIAQECQEMDTDRGLAQAVRLDKRNLLERLRKIKNKQDGFFFRGLSLLNAGKGRKSVSREITTYLITAIDDTDEDGIESFIERIHRTEHWDEATPEAFLLGTGSFGSVYKSELMGSSVAVKRTAMQSSESFWNEVSVLANTRHPRLAQLVFAGVSDEDTGVCRLYTELLGQSLDTVLENGPTPSLSVAVEIMLQVAEGMAFLHRRGVLHRNLNACNVLLVPTKTRQGLKRRKTGSSNLDEFVRIKITDYGLAKTKLAGRALLERISDEDPPPGIHYRRKLPYWQAPESFRQAEPEPVFTKKSDVYGFALFCYHILSSSRPFSDVEWLSENELYELVSVENSRPDVLKYCPAYLAALVHKCWNQELDQRPSFTQITLALQSIKGLIIRRKSTDENLLPCTPSDFNHLSTQLGLTFFMDAIMLQKKKMQRENEHLFVTMLERDKMQWPFPIDTFVLWLSSSVEQLENEEGFGAAAELAGDLTANWIGPNHEFEQAVFWYYKASSCKSKASGGSARWKLGMCLESGLGIAKDEKRAMGMYKQAAREGCASAYVELGRCFQACELDKSVAHFAKAMEMGKFDCVDLWMRLLASAAREEDCVWGGERVYETAAKTRLGRMVVAGRDCCNVRELVGILGDWRVKEVARRKAKLVLERLAVEDDILQQALLA